MNKTVFRNVTFDRSSPVERWPSEAIETLLDRGTLSDWALLRAAVIDDPWGRVAVIVDRLVNQENTAEFDGYYGVDALLSRVLERERLRGRYRYAAKIRQMRQSCGMTMREFAAAVGLSASRISDYENARVAPTTDALGRIEDAVDRIDRYRR